MSTDDFSPMPSGVEKMSKQELWNWFARSTRAHAERSYLDKKFFVMTTGLHDAHYRTLGDPYQIIEAQRKRMKGLETQMTEMQKGYKKKFAKLLKEKQNAENA